MQNLYSIIMFLYQIYLFFFNFKFKCKSDKTLGYFKSRNGSHYSSRLFFKSVILVFLKDDGQIEGEGDFFSQEVLDDENDSSAEESDAVNSSETIQDNVSTWKSKQEFILRQRKQTYQVKDSVLFILSTIKNSSLVTVLIVYDGE